jgi:hypothetical protein
VRTTQTHQWRRVVGSTCGAALPSSGSNALTDLNGGSPKSGRGAGRQLRSKAVDTRRIATHPRPRGVRSPSHHELPALLTSTSCGQAERYQRAESVPSWRQLRRQLRRDPRYLVPAVAWDPPHCSPVPPPGCETPSAVGRNPDHFMCSTAECVCEEV